MKKLTLLTNLKPNDVVLYNGQRKTFQYSQYQASNVDLILYFTDGTRSEHLHEMASIPVLEFETSEQYQERMVKIAIDELTKQKIELMQLIAKLTTLHRDMQRTQDRLVGVLPPLEEGNQA